TRVGETISGIFSGVVSGIKSLINGAIGGINKVIGITNKLPGVNIPKIPYLARGTSDWQGGLARINEGGRGELVHMPNGTTVVPHDVSMKYARESAKANSGIAYVDSNDEIAKSALKLANDAIKRPVVLNINGREVARTTGGDMRDYLNSRDMTLKRLRGEV
ncbi:phage tail protein, partial [Streptococcus pyogenes]